MRHTWGEIAVRSRRLMTRARRARPAGRRAGRDARLEQPPPSRAVLRGARAAGACCTRSTRASARRGCSSQLERCGDGALFVDASLTRPRWRSTATACRRCVVVMDDGAEVAPRRSPARRRYEAARRRRRAGARARPDARGPGAVHLPHERHDGRRRGPSSTRTARSSCTRSARSRSTSTASRRGAVVLPLTPMFHLMAWGLPVLGRRSPPATLVLAGADTSPEALAALIERERVTLAAGIPTFWVRLIDALEDPARDFSSLRRVLSGGCRGAAGARRALPRGGRRVRLRRGG